MALIFGRRRRYLLLLDTRFLIALASTNLSSRQMLNSYLWLALRRAIWLLSPHPLRLLIDMPSRIKLLSDLRNINMHLLRAPGRRASEMRQQEPNNISAHITVNQFLDLTSTTLPYPASSPPAQFALRPCRRGALPSHQSALCRSSRARW